MSLLGPVSGKEPVSRKWQDSCRALLVLYCNLPEKRRRGEAMKMTRLRNEIMADFDGIKDGKKAIDKSLMREDLEHWISGRTYFSMTKFQYVDRFILILRNGGNYNFLFRDLIRFKELEHRKNLTEIYARNEREQLDWAIKEFQNFRDRLFISEVFKIPYPDRGPLHLRMGKVSDSRQIAIFITDMNARSASVTVAYLDKPLSDLNSNPSTDKWKICFGYLTLVGADEHLPMIQCVLHVLRGEFPGSWEFGNTVSDIALHYDGRITSSWIPHVCAQNITYYIDSDDRYSSTVDSPRGTGAFIVNDRYEKVSSYLKHLTNEYVIW